MGHFQLATELSESFTVYCRSDLQIDTTEITFYWVVKFLTGGYLSPQQVNLHV